MKQAFKVDATDDLSDIHCVLYPEREVERVWKQLLVRDNICHLLILICLPSHSVCTLCTSVHAGKVLDTDFFYFIFQ